MAEMRALSVRELTDQAINKLPWARRKSAQWMMRRHGEEIVDHMIAKLCDEPECSDCVPMMNAEGFDGSMKLAIDPDKIAKWIELILKYLPIILAFFK